VTNKNIPCPLSCGVCCDEHWRDVFHGAPESQRQCEHLGENGCKLTRRKRPIACTWYLCSLAQCVIAGVVTPKAAERYLEHAEHDSVGLDQMLWEHKQKRRQRRQKGKS
jgi:hypothetical protein